LMAFSKSSFGFRFCLASLHLSMFKTISIGLLKHSIFLFHWPSYCLVDLYYHHRLPFLCWFNIWVEVRDVFLMVLETNWI
jgi:hypothetical protein